jgi:hypothetical protein
MSKAAKPRKRKTKTSIAHLRAVTFKEVVGCLVFFTGRAASSFYYATPLAQILRNNLDRGTVAAKLSELPSFRARGIFLSAVSMKTANTVGDLVDLIEATARGTVPTGAARPKAKRPRRKARKATVSPRKSRRKSAVRKKTPKKATRRAVPVSRAKKSTGARLRRRAGIRRVKKAPAPSASSAAGRRSRSLKARSTRHGAPRKAASKKASTKLPSSGRTPRKRVSPISSDPRAPRSAATADVGANTTEAKSPPLAVRPPRRPRYPNAALFNLQAKALSRSDQIYPDQVVRLQLDIGELSADSRVQNPEPMPEAKLPKNADLDVVVSSTYFGVATDPDLLQRERPSIAQGRFFLPDDGGPAQASGGGKYLNFFLKFHADEFLWHGRPAHARIGYYYNNILVQSQQLTVDLNRRRDPLVVTDFTTLDDLTGLDSMPKRPRISVLTNANDDGNHQIVLRHAAGGSAGEAVAATLEINSPNIGGTIRKLRAALNERAPKAKPRSATALKEDLRQLAPIGWNLYNQLPGQVPPNFFADLERDPEGYVVQVVRPSSSGFVLPWSYIYEIPLFSGVTPKLCPMVDKWDGTKPMFGGAPRQCPHGPHERDVLCPFGFWGYRYAIEQLSSSDQPVLTIPAAPGCDVVIGEAQYGIDLAGLQAHVARLRSALKAMPVNANLREGKDKASIELLLGADLPFVYFYCHGVRLNDADPNTSLGVGKNEIITTSDFTGWTKRWYSSLNKLIWDAVRPLVFINACHSLAIEPETLVSYLQAFVSRGRAAGVIGTEVQVEQNMAMAVAESFVARWMSGEQSVEETLRAIRIDYLKQGNLFGLVYTPYCWSELKIVTQ